jgi:hypothetical protein
MLRDRLSDRAVAIRDEAERPDENAAIAAWSEATKDFKTLPYIAARKRWAPFRMADHIAVASRE